MFTHNLDPILLSIGLITVRWYSLAYVFGIIIGWWYGKKIINRNFIKYEGETLIKKFDDLITYLIISIIVGGRIGYVFFYNFDYYIKNPLDILKIWEGGMSFHGALIGIIIGTYFFSITRKIKVFLLLDIIACVSPIGIFLGRVANFINGELVGKVTNVPWSVIFPGVDALPRHPSQLYEAFLEGIILFLIVNICIHKKNYSIGICSCQFLIYYGIFRIFSEFFREPDVQIGFLFGIISMGMVLSIVMIIAGIMIYYFLRKNEIKS